MKTTILYLLVFLLTSIKCTAQTNPCPEVNKYTKKMLKKVLTEDKNKDFRIKNGIQDITIHEIQVLESPGDSAVCKALKEDGFHYPEDPEMPTTITYFKANNLYFVVVHFSDTILRKEKGRIIVDTGPPGSIKIYDKNFKGVGNRLIF